MEAFLERLNDLTLLSQCHQTADIFNREYEKMLKELIEKIAALKALAVIQAAWLEAEKNNAEGTEQ